jgi:hypothetical protein
MTAILTLIALLVVSIGALLLLTEPALHDEPGREPPTGPWDWPEDSHFWHTQRIR